MAYPISESRWDVVELLLGLTPETTHVWYRLSLKVVMDMMFMQITLILLSCLIIIALDKLLKHLLLIRINTSLRKADQGEWSLLETFLDQVSNIAGADMMTIMRCEGLR